jgi:ferric-dicitrate binding protein FerR (iron transport regulator)
MNDKIWHLASKRLADELTTQETDEWDHWLAESPEHLVWWREMENLWQVSTLADRTTQFDPAGDWLRLQVQVSRPPRRSGRMMQPLGDKRWLQIAAVIVFLFALGASLFFFDIFPPGRQEMVTTGAGRQTLTLADGTQAFLNRDTRLRYPKTFQGKTRNVYLDAGEAYFEVVPDEQHPFLVSTSELTIEVLGTAFNVQHADPLVVSVSHGSVRVRAPGANVPSLILEKGERAIWNAREATLVRDTVSLNFLAWKTGILRFRDTPMEVVIADVSHFFRTNIQLKNPDLAGKRLTSAFDGASLDLVLETLALNYGLTVETTKDGYLLR